MGVTRCVHPYRQGVTHDRSRKLKWPLFCALSRTKSLILPPILHKNKENFALQNTPFFTKSRTIFQNYPYLRKSKDKFAGTSVMDPSVWKFLLLHEHRLTNVEILRTWILRTKKSQIWWKTDGKREKSARKYWIFRGVNRCGFWKNTLFFYFADTVLQNTLFFLISRTLNFRGQVMKTTPFPRFLERSCVHVVNGEWTHRGESFRFGLDRCVRQALKPLCKSWLLLAGPRMGGIQIKV